ncbi:MAG: hypothetical protein JKY61_00180 [Planctomycetes bacterium]|nr:hypothetical protein [Planctomycetota bacterium]
MLLTLLLTLVCAAPLTRQEGDDGIRFARSVLALSDLDGDGVCEFAVVAPASMGSSACSLWRKSPGRVLVLSGATRKVIQTWKGEPGLLLLGHSLQAVGDANRDGVADVLVGYERDCQLDLRSGKDGSLLQSFDSPDNGVQPFGDVDDDGLGDYVLMCVGGLEVWSGKGARVLVEKAAHGVKPRTVLLSEGEQPFALFAIPNPGNSGMGEGAFGYVSALMADVSGDGVSDLLIGDPLTFFYTTLRAY